MPSTNISDLRDIKQGPRGNEQAYFSRFEKAHLRTGSLLDKHEKISAYVNGFHKAIKSSVLLYLKQHPTSSLLEIVQVAGYERTLWRDRSAIIRKEFASPAVTPAKRSAGSSALGTNAMTASKEKEFLSACTEEGESEPPEVNAIPCGGYGRNRRKLRDVCRLCYMRGLKRQLPHPEEDCPDTGVGISSLQPCAVCVAACHRKISLAYIVE